MTIAAEPSRWTTPHPVASVRHTLILVAIFLGFAVLGALGQQRAAAHAGALSHPSQPALLYLSLIAIEWGLVLYVWRAGLRPHGASLAELVGGRWSRPRDVATDLAIALGTWGLWTVAGAAVERWFGADSAASVRSMLPRSPIEMITWVALSLSAGFAEELVFRGYFLAQFRAFTRSTWVAVTLQALLFGVSHGYQGARACLAISLYGLLLGGLATARKSLRPGMVAHAWTDIAGGIFRI